MIALYSRHRTALALGWFVLTLVVGLMCFPESSDASPIASVLCVVVSWFLGSVGRSLATLAIIVLGVGATLGKVSWGLAITVAVGIAVMLSAPTIVLALTGVSSGC